MKRLFVLLFVAAASAMAVYAAGLVTPEVVADVQSTLFPAEAAPKAPEPAPLAPLVTVAKAEEATFVETVLVTGTLVAREEILVGPEVDGLRVLALKADEGDRVEKGQVLAVLVQETLDAKLAESGAALAKANADIARAKSGVVEVEARVKEADAALRRAEPLRKSGYLSQSVYDQRESAARTARAALVGARDALAAAEAEKARVEAQGRETKFRAGNAEVTAPAAGLVSRRNVRVGGMASLAGEPMFRIVRDGEIELDAEVPETELTKIDSGDRARISAAGVAAEVEGAVRLVSPEVDRATRLGRVRVFLGDKPTLRIGSFGRGRIETAESRGLAVPASAVMYGADGPYVQVVEQERVRRRNVGLGLRMGSLTEVRSGLEAGDLVVAKAGTFLRDGDAVRPFASEAKTSEARPSGVKPTGAAP